MDKHIEPFEFIDIENIKLEPEYENELLEDPLLPRQADIELIKRNLKEEPQVKLGLIKDEIIELERSSKNDEQLIESDTFHRKNNEVISRFSSNTTVISGKDSYRVTDKLPTVEPTEDSEITDGNCIDSIIGSSSGKSVKTQLRHSHKKQTYSCEHCSFEATDINYLQKHITVIHNRNKIKKCPLCPKEFEEMSSLNNHVKIEHPNYKLFHCEDCEHYTHRRSDLKHHVTTVHSGVKPFHCIHCNRFFSRKGDLKHHITTVHLQIKTSKCPYCYKLLSAKYFKVHIKTVHFKGDKLYCSECKFSTYTLSQLKHHNNLVHILKKAEFICNYCQRVFTLKKSLVSHIKAVHFKQRDWKCTYCSYAAVTKLCLKNHVIRKHTEGGRPRKFPCPLCSYKAIERRTLDNHMKVIHTENDNPFKCHLCDQTFTLKAHFTRHLKLYHLA